MRVYSNGARTGQVLKIYDKLVFFCGFDRLELQSVLVEKWPARNAYQGRQHGATQDEQKGVHEPLRVEPVHETNDPRGPKDEHVNLLRFVLTHKVHLAIS